MSEDTYETANVIKSIQTSAYSRQLVGGEAHLCALYLANSQYGCVGGTQDKSTKLVQEIKTVTTLTVQQFLPLKCEDKK